MKKKKKLQHNMNKTGKHIEEKEKRKHKRKNKKKRKKK